MPDSTAIATTPAETGLNTPVHRPEATVPPPASSYILPKDFAEADYGGICTSIIDSIGADTISGRIPHFIPVEDAEFLRLQEEFDSIAAASVKPEMPSGAEVLLAPDTLPSNTGNDSALIVLMMGILALLGFSGGGIWRALRTYRHDLWNIRRPNVFDDEHTVPLSTGILLAVNTIVFGGIVLYTLAGEPTYDGFGPIGISIGIMAAYYIFRLTAYEVVGYTFGTPEGRRRWLDGFFATEAFTGIVLILPAILLLLQPRWHSALIIFSLTVVIVARLIFICKGIRIFYVNFRSLLYFILYLCTLEIVPLLALYGSCAYLQ